MKDAEHSQSNFALGPLAAACSKSGYETYLIPGETLIPGGRGKRFTLVLDMPHI